MQCGILGIALLLGTALPGVQDPSVAVAEARFRRDVGLCPAKIQGLVDDLRGQKGRDMPDIIKRHFGPPHRNLGSGVYIWQWDMREGVLTYSAPGDRPTFRLNSGRTVQLTLRLTPLYVCLVRDHEMDTAPGSKHPGTSFYIGNLMLDSKGGYRFMDSGANLDQRGGQSKNFFMRHPAGTYTVAYAKGVGPRTVLESLSAKMDLATITFRGEKVAPLTMKLIYDPALGWARLHGGASQSFRLR